MKSFDCSADPNQFNLRQRLDWHGYVGAALIYSFSRNCGLWLGIAIVFALYFSTPAIAIPSFARQTGQPCGTCHTVFPELTPYGRRFKLGGYTTGGGQFKTSLFGSPFDSPDNSKSSSDKLRSYAKAIDPSYYNDSNDKPWVPPVSAMAVIGLTHTQAPLDTIIGPPPAYDPYKSNNNVIVAPYSFFWGGAITSDVGAFIQVTHSPPPAGGFGSDPFGHEWNWDNTDVRFVRSGVIGGVPFIFGITANNSPTVQDVWNTTPAWSYSANVASTLAPTPGSKTLLEGAFAAHVGGVGVYTFINDMLYLEASGYQTLGFRQQNSVGIDPFGAPGLIAGTAPYWRVAFEPHWGSHSLMVGTFGMIANVRPWIDQGFASGTNITDAFPQSDRFTDIGFDTQYQYQGPNWWLTLHGTYIRETQKLDATFNILGGSANPTNELNRLILNGQLVFGSDNKIALTAQYSQTRGTPDAILYGGNASGFSPNSDAWLAEISYMPFGSSKSPIWPWANARIGVQYTAYTKFDGTSLGASDHNTLFLYAWMAM